VRGYVSLNVEAAGDPPIGTRTAELTQVADVANVVALAALVVVDPIELAPGHLLDALEHRNAVGAAAFIPRDSQQREVGTTFLEGPAQYPAVVPHSVRGRVSSSEKGNNQDELFGLPIKWFYVNRLSE
jgi:hypothetical protein